MSLMLSKRKVKKDGPLSSTSPFMIFLVMLKQFRLLKLKLPESMVERTYSLSLIEQVLSSLGRYSAMCSETYPEAPRVTKYLSFFISLSPLKFLMRFLLRVEMIDLYFQFSFKLLSSFVMQSQQKSLYLEADMFEGFLLVISREHFGQENASVLTILFTSFELYPLKSLKMSSCFYLQ